MKSSGSRQQQYAVIQSFYIKFAHWVTQTKICSVIVVIRFDSIQLTFPVINTKISDDAWVHIHIKCFELSCTATKIKTVQNFKLFTTNFFCTAQILNALLWPYNQFNFRIRFRFVYLESKFWTVPPWTAPKSVCMWRILAFQNEMKPLPSQCQASAIQSTKHIRNTTTFFISLHFDPSDSNVRDLQKCLWGSACL